MTSQIVINNNMKSEDKLWSYIALIALVILMLSIYMIHLEQMACITTNSTAKQCQ